MNLNELLNPDSEDGRGVSPVIGVILMVAITVILAAVIGTFVLGLGDQVQETAPTAQFSWDETNEDSTDDTVTVTHQTGDNINVDNINISADGGVFTQDIGALDDIDRISAGTQIEIAASEVENSDAVDVGETGGVTISVVWESQGGERSDTLTTYTTSDDFEDDS